MAKQPRKGMTTQKPPKPQQETIPTREEIIGSARAELNREVKAKSGKTHRGPGRPGREDQAIYKGITFPIALRDEFQVAADQETSGNFSALLERAFLEFLGDPTFQRGHVGKDEGPRKNKPTSLPIALIQEIQEQADALTVGNFSRLTQEIVKGWLVRNNYL
jgi:hypothetical protein